MIAPDKKDIANAPRMLQFKKSQHINNSRKGCLLELSQRGQKTVEDILKFVHKKV